jgi:hypothetical protein
VIEHPFNFFKVKTMMMMQSKEILIQDSTGAIYVFSSSSSSLGETKANMYNCPLSGRWRVLVGQEIILAIG